MTVTSATSRVGGCICSVPSALLCPGADTAVKVALPLRTEYTQAAITIKVFRLHLSVLLPCCYGDRYCAYSPPPQNKEGPDGSFLDVVIITADEMVMPDNKTVRCQTDDVPCFSLWGVDVPGNNESYLVQGCWLKKTRECIFGSQCISTWGPSRPNFCCCHGDMCNTNMSANMSLARESSPIQQQEQQDIIPLSRNYKQLTIIVALSSVSCVAVIISLSYFLYRKVCLPPRPKLPEPPDNSDMYLVKSPSTPSFELEQLKFEEVISRGRYGEVWKGTLNDMDVAIKVFTASQQAYFVNERDIYLLPHMDHESVVTFFGAEERVTPEGNVQYLLVMSYVPQGTLTAYLKNNTLDWSFLCKMGYSITSGLAYLHSEVVRGDLTKPAIAHRDLNSRNVLVNSDLSCCICDFGFAMKIKRNRLLCNGAEANVEQATLTDVGTLLYMAPEVLEGAVNLRDCESSLKQIDIYALGLVLWELASRCSALYQGMPVPEYKLPYQAEIGVQPTFEEMQLLVTKNKARPAFPDVWKDTNQAIRALKETIEDCWDQDGEARLTALCVEERMLEMMTLWDHRHKGITPTMLASGLENLEEKTEVQHNLMPCSPPPSLVVDGATCLQRLDDGNLNLAADLTQSEPVNELSQAAARRSQRTSYTDNSISAASTVETTLSPSELEDHAILGKADCNVIYAQTNRALRPQQGQNPTVERNTHKRSDEDVTIMGNTLVNKSEMPMTASGSSSTTSQSMRNRIPNTTMAVLPDDILGAFSDNLESSLVQNDLLNQSQRHQHMAPPPPQAGIPYVQNQVHQNHMASEPLIVRPKQPNVPGNGYHGNRHTNNVSSNVASSTQKPSNWFNLFRKSHGEKKETNKDIPDHKALLPGKEKEVGVKRSFPFFGKFTTGLLSSPSGNSSASSDSSKGSTKSGYVPTEVRVVNGSPVVRPTSLPIQDSGSSSGGGWQSSDHSSIVTAVPNSTVHQMMMNGQPSERLDGSSASASEGVASGRSNTLPHSNGTRPGGTRMRAKCRGNAALTPGGGAEGSGSQVRRGPADIQMSDFESNRRARRPNSLSVSSYVSSTSSNTDGSPSATVSPTFL
ncbi:hypothetical protein LSH36_277g01029 [Paralvinella palmiformis]|uniref:Serine/threonine-protein kinase receptor n=1 Tax=Paralvinella palmiformis TaxID=53620 RepID=A0AAD9JKE9_9ANNE|nr:hypothetical protein LSH36_277g01029 [Paralvinella palmiformis]